MTYQEIATMVSGIGLPFAYYQFPVNEAPPLPYVVYFFPNRDDFVRDNENYRRVETLIIELYTEDKSLTTESEVEDVLENNHIVYDKTETFIRKENMYQCYYEAEVLITPQVT